MKLKLSDILEYITDYTGDFQLDNYPQDERLRDINQTYTQIIYTIDKLRGTEWRNINNKSSYKEIVAIAGTTNIDTSSFIIDKVSVFDTPTEKDMKPISISDGDVLDKDTYIIKEGFIEVTERDIDTTFRIYQAQEITPFVATDLQSYPMLPEYAHIILAVQPAILYMNKRSKTIPEAIYKIEKEAMDILKDNYNTSKVFRMSTDNTN